MPAPPVTGVPPPPTPGADADPVVVKSVPGIYKAAPTAGPLANLDPKLKKVIIGVAAAAGFVVLVLLAMHMRTASGRKTHFSGDFHIEQYGLTMTLPERGWYRSVVQGDMQNELGTFYRGAVRPYDCTLKLLRAPMNSEFPEKISDDMLQPMEEYFVTQLERFLTTFGYAYKNISIEKYPGPGGRDALHLRGTATMQGNKKKSSTMDFYIVIQGDSEFIFWFNTPSKKAAELAGEIDTIMGSLSIEE